jgi:hypothetical protein
MPCSSQAEHTLAPASIELVSKRHSLMAVFVHRLRFFSNLISHRECSKKRRRAERPLTRSFESANEWLTTSGRSDFSTFHVIVCTADSEQLACGLSVVFQDT